MSEVKSTIEPIFAVPFASVLYPDAGDLNAELSKHLFELESQGDSQKNQQPMVNRNGEVFESHFQLFDSTQPAIQALRLFCYQQLYQVVGQLNSYTVDMLKNLHIAVESWFHITRRGGYFPIHNHALHSWSGIYCVDPGQHSDVDSTNGLLSFVSPFAMNTMFMDMAVVRMMGGYNYGPREIRLTAGQLLLFPSWLLHEVRPYTADGARITVAFNAKFKLAGAMPDNIPASNLT
ncbi:MAG: hypothetical protein EBS77_05485 [Gammaproteobacteria bacterium]|jgi:uncharacterized protein (TIGR02466 family)|nr:hypothetical protein [Gammaproteobacteria bacterium]